MEILELHKKSDQSVKLTRKYLAFERLIAALKNRELPITIATTINNEIELINHFEGSDSRLMNHLTGAQKRILELLEKKLHIVLKNHYRNLWMVLGMSGFGIPLGVVWGIISGNMAILGIGLPIGMAIGIAVGAAMDKKANREGRQLDLDLKC